MLDSLAPAGIRRTLIGCAGVLAAAGCIPLPIPHTTQATPTVTGTLHTSEGVPMAGIPVAVTGSDKDMRCAGPGGRGFTDSMGRFRLAAANVRKRVFWLTMMENFGHTPYWLCADAGGVLAPGSQLDSLTTRTFIFGRLSGDTLTCIGWTWRGAARVSCNGSVHKQFLSEGTWTEGAVTGAYRLLLPHEGAWGYPTRAVIQWLGPAVSPRAPGTLHTQVELPTGKGVQADGARIERRGHGWQVTLLSVEKTKWNNDRWLTFELGPPGQVRQTPDR